MAELGGRQMHIVPGSEKNIKITTVEDQMCIRDSTYLVWTERGRKFIHDLAQRYWALSEK